ncbi:Pycsar system effector family protein [Burkholderia cepacia]|uniref:Pycsar system effector family protein n=1 Tax=Burkholderia cepacia TaxID=292 RepID=UPI002AB6A7A0|nr:Pycsar system effector family protein [Burkholderia cepacia]
MAGTRTHEEQQKLLLEIIKRFDGYINATNSKIAVVLSYCMAYIGGLGFKLVDLSDKRLHDNWWWALLAISLLSVLATLVAAKYTYQALRPQTPPGRALHEKPSAIFFGDVASHAGGRDGYAVYLGSLTAEDITADLSSQAHVLASIADSKFRLLGCGIAWLVRVQLPSFGMVLVMLITSLSKAS